MERRHGEKVRHLLNVLHLLNAPSQFFWGRGFFLTDMHPRKSLTDPSAHPSLLRVTDACRHGPRVDSHSQSKHDHTIRGALWDHVFPFSLLSFDALLPSL